MRILLALVLGVSSVSLTQATLAVRTDGPAVVQAAGGESAADAGGGDDDRVAVQLVVLGIVIGAVFVVGTGAYVLRWKLGRTAYTPPADSGHH